jgi:hypothetical protein
MESSEEETSIEFIEQEHPLQETRFSAASRQEPMGVAGVTMTHSPKKPTRVEIQEQRDKARAWHLERVRDKQNK